MAYHALQYEDLYVVENSFNGITSQIDTEALGNHIHFGPQAHVCEKLQQFNTIWNSNLEITKTFKWKRGTYQKVAELINKKLEFDVKPNGMYTFLSRQDYFRRHRWEAVRNDLRDLDDILCTNRYTGEIWLEDPSILTERKSGYSNYLSEQMDNAHNLGQNIPQYLNLTNTLQIAPNSSSNRKYRLITTVTLDPINVKIYHTNGSSSAVAAREIQTIPSSLDIDVNIITYPLYDMIRNTTYSNPNFQIDVKGNVFSKDNVGFVQFPYISRAYRTTDGGGSVCFGDEATNINNSIRSMDMTSILLQLTNWCQSYTTSTTPHFNIKLMFNGMPSYINEEFRQTFGSNTSRDCNYDLYSTDVDEEESYCHVSGCTLRETCSQYAEVFPEPTVEEVPVELIAQTPEQLTLQWATRMGGNPVQNTPDLPIQGDREQEPSLIDRQLVGPNTGVLTDEMYEEYQREHEEYQRDLAENPEPNNEEE